MQECHATVCPTDSSGLLGDDKAELFSISQHKWKFSLSIGMRLYLCKSRSEMASPIHQYVNFTHNQKRSHEKGVS